jgi:hypothetical protein
MVAAASSDIAEELGQVIGAEKPCGLTLNDDAISNYVQKHVAPGDMEFPILLKVYTISGKFDAEHMTPVALTAYCTQMRRIVQHYGFSK